MKHLAILLAVLIAAPAQAYLTPIGGGGGSGTVTSVDVTLPASTFSLTGGPVTTSGTIAGSFIVQPAHYSLMGPASGADATPTWRQPSFADISGTIGNAQTTGSSVKSNSTLMLRDGTGAVVTGDTTAQGLLYADAQVDAICSGLQYGNSALGSPQKWCVYVNPGNGTVAVFNVAQSHTALGYGQAYGMWTGENAGVYEFEANLAATETDTSVDPSAQQLPFIAARQTNSTVNNFEGMGFGNQGQASIATIIGVNENHNGHGSQTGHLETHVWNAGTNIDAFHVMKTGKVKVNQLLQIPPQGAASTPACASGDEGTLAFTSAFLLCVCNGSSWVTAATGVTACTF